MTPDPLRVVCLADLHGQLPGDVPPADLLIVAGDIAGGSREQNERFLRRDFPLWLDRQPVAEIVGIAGNHDYVARQWPSVYRSYPWTYLDNELRTVAGLKVWGSAWTPRFGHWPFMADDDNLASLWAQIPDDVDLLVTHGPIHGYLDMTISGVSSGSRTLKKRLLELPNLKLHVCGHIHEAHGQDSLGTTWLVNGSLVNERYEMVNPPILVDLI